MVTSSFYELNLKPCPVDLTGRATYRFGQWRKEPRTLINRLQDDQKSIDLFIAGCDGSSVETTNEWKINLPLQILLHSKNGAWLVPADTEGSYSLCANEQQATWIILSLAESIWRKTQKAPNIEAVRLDSLDQGKLRIYSFWFPFRGQEPTVESQSIQISTTPSESSVS